MNLATSKRRFMKQKGSLFIRLINIRKKSSFDVAGVFHPPLNCDKFVLQYVKTICQVRWFLLREVIKHTTLIYLCIFKKSIRKSQIDICVVPYFVKAVELPTTTYLELIQQRCFDRDSTTIMEDILRLKQLQLNYINNKKAK